MVQTHHLSHKSYCKLWLLRAPCLHDAVHLAILGACFFPGTHLDYIMPAYDRVTTMVSRTCSTINGHPEVKQKIAEQFFSSFWLTRSSQATPFATCETRIWLCVESRPSP